MVATGAMAAVGAIATAWPFINNLNPRPIRSRLAQIEVNVQADRGRPGDHR
jgi:ubiquinol-cytochrome c reductase iron-sulfur subunit